MTTILRETANCVLYQTGQQTRVATKQRATPKSRRVSADDAAYLLGLSERDFDCAAVLDFGVGVFA
jgi:hypothetical protein